MKQVPSFIGWFLVSIAFGLYIYGVYCAIFIQLTGKAGAINIPEPLETLTSSLGAIFLTNLGAVLGISVSKPESGLARKILFSKASDPNPPPLSKREMIQFASVILYLVSLVACFAVWASTSFETDPMKLVPFIAQAGKTLIGVITAYLAFVLGVKQA